MTTERIDPSLTLQEVLTPDELALLGYPGDAWKGSLAWDQVHDFRKNALDMFGESWPDHVPGPRQSPLSAVTQYLFGEILWGYQLKILYCPSPEIQTIGARGTGKTKMFGMIGALWTACHPGNNWLHAAPSKDQSEKCYNYIIGDGAHGLEKGRAFMDLFIVHKRKAPFAELMFRPWDEYDPGSSAMFRSTGKPNEPGELLRSHEVGLITVDEAFRTFLSEWALLVLAGCIRGLNEWRANQAPELKRQWQDMAMDYTMEQDPEQRDILEDQMNEFAYDNGLAKEGWQWTGGNAGWYRWPYRKQARAKREGYSKVYAITWKTSWNPAFTKKQRLEVERKYAHDPDALAMELEGKRPPPPGDIYVEEQIGMLFSPKLDAEVIQGALLEKPGYIYQRHEDLGVYRFAFPPRSGRIYAGGADGGTKQVPDRGKWVIILADITDDPPFPIVYFEQGNITSAGRGSIMPWLSRLRELTTRNEGDLYYEMAHASLYADATGLQRWVHEVAQTWLQPVEVYPFVMTSKPGLILKSQLMLSHGIFASPTVEQWEYEMGVYTIPDPKPLQQDIIMSMLALCQATWDFKGEGLGISYDTQMEQRAEDEMQARKALATMGIARLLHAEREIRHRRG